MEGMIGEIRLFGGNFAPRSWALCQGQLLPISQNTALFSILGTTYGGDGRTTFALPDLRGRVAIGNGNGPGLSDRRLGSKGGSETNTLNVTQLPSHNHTATGTVSPGASSAAGEESDPSGKVPASLANAYAEDANATMKASTVNVTVNNTGGNQPVNNMQPFLTLNYIICLQGVFPSRS